MDKEGEDTSGTTSYSTSDANITYASDNHWLEVDNHFLHKRTVENPLTAEQIRMMNERYYARVTKWSGLLGLGG